MANNTTTIKFVGQFDSSGITKGLQEIKKQMSNTHIGEDLRKQLETALNKVEANIPALEKMSAKSEFNEKELIAYQKLIQEISKDMANLNKIASEADFTKTFSAADNAKLEQFKKQLTDVENKLKTTRKEIIDNFSKTKEGQINGKSNATLNGFIEQLISVPPDQIEGKLDEIIKDVESQAENTVQKLKQDFATKANKNKIHKEDFINLIFGENSGVTFKEGKVLDNNKDNTKIGARTVYNQIREEILALKEDANSADIEEILNKYHAFIEEYFNVPEGKQSVLANIITPEIIEHLKNLSEHIPELKQALGEEGLKLLAEGEAEKVRITAEQTAFMKQTLDELAATGKITKEQAEAVAKALGLLNEQAEKGKNQIGAEKAQADALSATFGSLAHRIESAVSAMAIFNKSIQIMRQAIRSVEELDAAFTQIAIVSEQSNESAWKMFDSFNKLAKQYSITTKDLTEGAKLFYQQGLNAADTMKMVEASTISAALGEVTMTEAANTLTAAIQGYNESAAVAMDYTDKIAMVGAVSAADFNELSAAMEKTASSAYTAGIDFDHLLGYLGKMIEVTREAPANLGTAMKTIIARFEDMKKDPNALIDGASANKVEAALATIGIALRDTAGEFRPLQEVFDELGQKWQDLTRNQQAYIATVAAGSRQQSRFLAMMNNYDRTLELIVESQNSAGAAAEQYAIYQDSIAAAQNRLTASWEKFYSKIVDNSAIKFAINSLSELVEALSHVPPAITAIGASLGALRLQEFIRGTGGKNLLNTIFGEVLKNENGEIEKVGSNIVKKFFEGIKKKGWKELYNDSKKFSTDFPKMIKGVGSSLKNLTIDIFKAGEALAAFLVANWQFIAITAAIGGLIYLLRQAAQRVNNLAKEIHKLKTEANEKFNTATNLEQLLKTYDDLTSKIVLTEEEQETLNSTIEEIGSSYEGAITYVDRYGNMVLTNTETVKQHTKALKDEAYEMEKNAIKLQKEFLNSDRNKWTKENFQNAGFGEYWEQYNSTGGKLGGVSSEFLNLIENNEATIGGIKEGFFGDRILNEFINLQKSTGIIADDSETIAEYWAEVTAEVGELTEGYNDVIKLMEKDVDIKELKNEIDHDDTLEVEQQIAAYKILGKLSDSSLDSWETLKQSLKDSNISLKEFIITLSKAENPDELFKNIEDYLNGNGSSEAQEKLRKSFESAGISGAEAFIEAFIAEFKSKEEELNKKIQEWADKNGITINIEGLTYNEKKLYSDLLPLFQEGGELYDPTKDKERIGTDYSTGNPIYKNTKMQQFSDLFGEEGNAKAIQEFLDRIQLEVKNKNIDMLNEIEREASERFGTNGTLIDIINLFAEEGKENLIWQFSEADEAIFDSYKKAYEIFKSDAGEALSDKDLEFIAGTGIDIKPYIEINNQGEQYLSIMGKILLLQKTSEDYEKELLRAKSYNLEAIKNIEDELAKIPEKEKNIAGLELQIKQYSKDMTAHKETIDLLDKRLDRLKKIKQAQQEAATLGADIAKAKEAYDNVELIGKAYKEALENEGNLSLATAQSLIQMNDFNAAYLQVVNGRIQLTQEGAEAMKKIQEEEYQRWLDEENAKLDYQIGLYEVLRDAALDMANSETEITGQAAADQLGIIQQQYEIKHEDEKKALEKSGDQQDEALKQYVTNWGIALQAIQDEANEVFKNIATGTVKEWDVTDAIKKGLSNLKPVRIDNPISFDPVNAEDLIDIKDPQKAKDKLREMADEYQKRIDSLKKLKELLPSLGKSIADGYTKGLIDAASGSKEAEKALEDLTNVIENLVNALKDLDKLLKDVKQNLNDIDIDISPFTDLFEEWEHEWDYFYNIKTLISNIGRSRNMFSQISSAEWASPEQRIQADEAFLGATFADASARKKYAEGLYSTIIQKGTDMTEKYGQFGRFDPNTMTWYQRDDELIKLNEEQEKHVKEINRLQEEQWKKNNELETQNAVLEALEQQRDAHEDILNTLQDQYDSLVDNEDIQADVSGLEAQIAAEKQIIEGIDKEIEAQKAFIKTIEDQLKDIDFNLWKEEDAYNFWDKFVSDMEDDIGNINDMMGEYYDNVDAIMEDANAYWEMYISYIETAINTQQELYDAIVENYQKEIDEKKRQYDYLKQLDNEYLQSVKNNIDEERRAREDSNKQKSYQKNVQRAQLLQMDTSGAYRTELANLKKDIESQRQDLYDDLVDKQVEALEKEVEKRHELYDKEVAALEERLAYMQENAILLWDMVDGIIAQGSEAIMQTLENTTDYINSNELKKEQQRRTWENNIKKTVKVATDDTVQKWGAISKVLGEIATQTYPNFKKETDEFSGVLDKAEKAVGNYADAIQRGIDSLDDVMPKMVASLSTAMDEYTKGWATATSLFTGNVTEYGNVVNNMISSTSTNIKTLNDWNSGLSTSGDKIIQTIDTYNEKLADKYAEIYQTYEEERQTHKDELDGIIKQIGDEISAAVRDAADAIRRAAESIQVNSSGSNGSYNSSGNTNPGGNTEPTQPTNPGGGDEQRTYKGWKADFSYQNDGHVTKITRNLGEGKTETELYNDWREYLNNLRKKFPNATSWGLTYYEKGGLASSTGPAWLDGTKSNPERVLSPKQTKLFESMVSSLERVSLNNSNINSALGSSYNIGDINTNINVEKLDNETDINRVARQVEDRIMKSIRNRISVAIA